MAFRQIAGAQAVISAAGVMKPCGVFEFNNGLYAAAYGGYIRLYENGSTSHKNAYCHALHYDGPLWSDHFGRLTIVRPNPRRPALRVTVDADDGATAILPAPGDC